MKITVKIGQKEFHVFQNRFMKMILLVKKNYAAEVLQKKSKIADSNISSIDPC